MNDTGHPPPFKIMGIVNCTPDSFSDGGQFSSSQQAIEHALQLCMDGADIIDLGAESTRPGASVVTTEEEWNRLLPVLSGLKRHLPSGAKISIDTRKPDLMIRCAEIGVDFINNVKGVPPFPQLSRLSTFSGLSIIAMHMHECPEIMQKQPLSGKHALSAFQSFLLSSSESLSQAGFDPEQQFFDPGIGFGKDDQANVLLMANIPVYAKKYNMVVGVSRKSWLGRCLNIPEPVMRDAPSKIAELALALAGARIIRTHEVKTLNRLRRLLLQD